MKMESPESSPTQSPLNSRNSNVQSQNTLEMPTEIISEEEMALIDGALAIATARSSLSASTQFHRNAKCIGSISLLSKRGLSGVSTVPDFEDFGGEFRSTQKRNRVKESLLYRFRRKRGFFVTDITASVTQRVRVHVETNEDSWALKFMNFIRGANQLLFDGLTRELTLIGFAEGVWMAGVIDEIRMPVTETKRNLTLVENKTRSQASFPLESQRRNARLQLMCYKYLWDNIVAEKFPYRKFFDFFSLNPHYILCEDIRENTAKSGFPAKTLDDLVRYYQNTCSLLPLAHDKLLLRYEFQKDQSLIGEDQFAYDSDWVQGQIKFSLEFWRGERDATYLPEEERWKCNFCGYASQCPINTTPENTPT